MYPERTHRCHLYGWPGGAYPSGGLRAGATVPLDDLTEVPRAGASAIPTGGPRYWPAISVPPTVRACCWCAGCWVSRGAGSDLPAGLRTIHTSAGRGLRAALLGEPGVGDMARSALNRGDTKRLECVATIDPGVVTPENMVDPKILEQINATKSDFLIVALGAQKGQAWLVANRGKLAVPVVSHLGATLNFLAGAVRRAPEGVRKLGLEWLWRIKEEPKLAPRHLSDGGRLAWLLLTRVLPLSLWLRRARKDGGAEGNGVWLDMDEPRYCAVTLGGGLGDAELAPAVEAFCGAVQTGLDIHLDFSRVQSFGMAFAGQVLMLEKSLHKQNRSLAIAGAAPTVSRALVWCGLGHLKSNCSGT